EDQGSNNEYGFLRENAILSIVFVTDEVDCSYNPDHDSIFNRSASATKVFWSNQDDDYPTSAVCWNAGVKCEGGDELAWGSCDPQDYDEEGNEVSSEDAAEDAVLRPLSRYIEAVANIERRKKEINNTQEVLVAAISGVPTNYSDTGEIVYQKGTGSSTNPNF